MDDSFLKKYLIDTDLNDSVCINRGVACGLLDIPPPPPHVFPPNNMDTPTPSQKRSTLRKGNNLLPCGEQSISFSEKRYKF